MSGFEPNAIIRGAQLTLVGAYRALQNPDLFKHEVYRQAAAAVAVGIALRVLVEIPVIGVRVVLSILSYFTTFQSADHVIEKLHFIQHSVLQLPLPFISMMKYLTPAMDNMFMESLHWVDKTYRAKHQGDDPQKLRAMYYPNMRQYPMYGDAMSKNKASSAFMAVTLRFGRKGLLSLAVYALSHLPVVGRLVLPAASFYAFNKAVGTTPALVIFGTGLVLPRKVLVVFLQSYFSSRTLMRELLEPYFARIRLSKQQRREWFRDREGVLFGFALGFFLFLKIPLLGVLIYGIAEASAAFLVTKITDPPPPPDEAGDFVESQVRWKNKHDFLKLEHGDLDALNVLIPPYNKPVDTTELKGRQFT